MKKLVTTLTLALATLSSGIALAGYKFSQPVNIIVANKHAYGSIGSTRNTPDSVQWFGCYVSGYATGSAQVGCFARDAGGTYVTCYSSNQELVKAAQALKGDSYLQFRYDDAGQCTFILAHNNSSQEPKQP